MAAMKDDFYVVNVEAAIYKEDKWLIIKRGEGEDHAAGTLSFVGGKVEGDENKGDILEETLKREVREEIGIEIEIVTYIESHLFKTDDDSSVVDIVFLCKYLSGEPTVSDKGEVAEFNWVRIEEALSNPKTPDWIKDSLKLADKAK